MAKAQILEKSYVTQDGERRKHVGPDAVALFFKFGNGTEHKIELGEFNESVLRCAAWHGISQRLGDKAAGKDPDAAEEAFLDCYENMVGETGTWLKEGTRAAPRVTLLAQALHELKPDKYADVEAAQAEIKSWSDEEKQAKVKIKAFDAKIQEVRARAAMDRAKKAQAQAAEDGGDVASL